MSTGEERRQVLGGVRVSIRRRDVAAPERPTVVLMLLVRAVRSWPD
jgi:hypothetical protein